jgi:hypothetical protein
MLAEPLLLNDICYFWISFRQIGHMEKRSLQSGNTFFPVIERRLTGSPAASFIENCVMMRARGNRYIKGL